MANDTLTASSNADRTGEQATTLTIDDATDLLSSRRRRRAVAYLNQNGDADLSEVAEAVASEEFGPGHSTEEYKRVYVALYQSHVPKLADYGIVDYSGTAEPVRPGPEFDGAVRYLSALQRVEEETGNRGRFRTLRDLL